MSIAPDQVQAPAADAVLFRSSPARTFLTVYAVLLLCYLAVSPLVSLVVGGTGDPWWVTVPEAAVVGAVAAGCYAFSGRGALTTWVRVSSGGLELAAQGSDPILLAWSDVAAVEVRRDGLREVLHVFPVDLDTVHPVQGPDAGWPTMTETPHGTAFTADLTQLWPGPRALRRELARRLPRSA